MENTGTTVDRVAGRGRGRRGGRLAAVLILPVVVVGSALVGSGSAHAAPAAPGLVTATTPGSGTVLGRRGPSGPGEFSVENDADRDAVVTLARDDGRAVDRVYVRAHQVAPLHDVADGTYDIFATFGRWDPRAATMLDPDAVHMDRRADFDSHVSGDTQYYSQVSVALEPPKDANTTLTSVSADAVPH